MEDHPLKVQLLIFICVQFGCSGMYTFWVVKHQSNTLFDYFVCNSLGSSPTGATPTTTYILMQELHYFASCMFQTFVIKKSKKVSLIWYQTYIDMWSIFGVKLNYITIFEKSCNSSTLLMELFMICDQLEHMLVKLEQNVRVRTI